MTAPVRSPAQPHSAAPALDPLPPERLLQDWAGAHQRALDYLAALQVPESERGERAWRAVTRAAAQDVWPAGADAFERTLACLRDPLIAAPAAAQSEASSDAFLRWRIRSWLERAGAAGAAAALRGVTLSAMPALLRGHMRRSPEPRSGAARGSAPWLALARGRRLLLLLLVLVPSINAAGFMIDVLPHQGEGALELTIVVVFSVLFAWISVGFWTALLGFWVLVGGDRFGLLRGTGGELPALPAVAKTALVMPICEEPIPRTFAGLRAVLASLERSGASAHFDLFVLSDSASPSAWVEEEIAWAELCRDFNAFGRVFYRRRKVRRARKAGNVADFCRRWGRRYRYMVVLDADSVMAGEALVRLVQLMEANPGAAVIQTAPRAVLRRSLFGRMQQFAHRLYGPLFSAGLHFWQLGDGQYWGHNAILRVEPFMEHCRLPRLTGPPPLGGEIWSHDFVEAALLGRAGWSLWLAHDLPGSYEETPATLLEELQRDRRWCQGNLQHLRLLFAHGFSAAHRMLFLNGVFSYVSSALWLIFLVLGSSEAIYLAVSEPQYFPVGRSLFPDWPVWRPNWALSLAGVTAAILFVPKILAFTLVLLRGEARGFGGVFRLALSAVLEVLLSSLFAPIRMAFHSRFVVLNLLGRQVRWLSQWREDRQTRWREAWRHHGFDTLIASSWGLGLYWLNTDYFFWVTPVVGALVLSIPLSVLASRVRLGEWARRLGLFMTPEETSPPREIVDLTREAADLGARGFGAGEGFVRAAVDPYVSALHGALQAGGRSRSRSLREAREALLERALQEGPAALAAREQRILLADRDLIGRLHQRIWELSRGAGAAWRLPGSPGTPAP